MGWAESVRGNAGARIAVSSDFAMKDYGNGPNGSVTISMDCNQDDTTMTQVARGLSDWSIALAAEHYDKAEKKFQEMYYAKHPGKAPNPTLPAGAAHPNMPIFKP